MKVFRSALLEKCSGVIHGFVHDPGGPDILKIAHLTPSQTDRSS